MFGYMEIKMSEQQFQAEVMDELKMQDVMQEKLKQAYIDGWTKGMEDAAELLKTSVIKLEDILKTNLPSTIKLNQNEYDALISFTYNLGPGWSRSSGLRNLLVNSDYNGAADKLLEYSIAQGKTLKSLLRRRYTERDLFLRT